MTTTSDLRTKLEKRRRSLLARYNDTLAHAIEEREATSGDVVDVANDQWDIGLLSCMSNTDRKALAEITGALLRIDHGVYGACITCGRQVERQRLALLPETACCFECASAREELELAAGSHIL